MKLYELNYLASPEIPQAELKSFQEKISSLIQKEGGVLNETKSPTKIKLAYQVKSQREAFLSTLGFNFKTEKLEKLEKELRSEGRILRYLILTKPQPKISLVEGKKTSRKIKPKAKKVKLKEIEKKLEEILGTD